jgi:hypothetical protein
MTPHVAAQVAAALQRYRTTEAGLAMLKENAREPKAVVPKKER